MTHSRILNSYFSRLSRRGHSCARRVTRCAMFVFTFIVLFGAMDTSVLVSGAAAAPATPRTLGYLCDTSGKGFCATTFAGRTTTNTPIITTNTKAKSSTAPLTWGIENTVHTVGSLKPFTYGRFNTKYFGDPVYRIKLRGTNECMSPKPHGTRWELVLEPCTNTDNYWIQSGGWFISPTATNATSKGKYLQILTSSYRPGSINGSLTTETGGKTAAFHQNWSFVKSKPRG